MNKLKAGFQYILKSNDQAQIQKTKETQMFKEQAIDTYESVTMAAEESLKENGKESIINRLTDGAILSLNAWIVSCKDIIKDGNKEALQIAEKTINDEWNSLQMNDIDTYNLTLAHKNFMIAAIHGQAKKFNRRRIKKSKAQLFDSSNQTINNTYAVLIGEQQKYDAHVKTFENPEISRKLQLEHANDLKNSKPQRPSQYSQPNVSNLYFTNSGQNGRFQSRTQGIEQKAMEDELNGVTNAYDELPEMKYNNALFITENNKYVPCQICAPIPGKTDKINIRIANADSTILCAVGQIECTDVDKIIKKEKKCIQKHGKLGYKSIRRQQCQNKQRNDDIGDAIMNGVEATAQASAHATISPVEFMQSDPEFRENQEILCHGKAAKIKSIDERGAYVTYRNITADVPKDGDDFIRTKDFDKYISTITPMNVD